MTRIDALLDRKDPQGAELPPPEERKRLRTAYGLTQAEVAESVGVKVASVSAWELGRWEPRGEARTQYAYLLREIKKRLGKEEGK